jgi:hypothetical protein
VITIHRSQKVFRHIGDATSRLASRSLVLISESTAGCRRPVFSEWELVLELLEPTNIYLLRAKTEEQFVDLREARDRTPLPAASPRLQNATLYPFPVLSRIQLGALLERFRIFAPYGGFKIRLDLQ